MDSMIKEGRPCHNAYVMHTKKCLLCQLVDAQRRPTFPAVVRCEEGRRLVREAAHEAREGIQRKGLTFE